MSKLKTGKDRTGSVLKDNIADVRLFIERSSSQRGEYSFNLEKTPSGDTDFNLTEEHEE